VKMRCRWKLVFWR